jgi:cytochrome c oxidase assembly factor CtaG
MIVWHVPALFNAALADDGIHILQHLSFLVTGVIFWWPVLAPSETRRMAPFAAISYLFGACLTCSLLGAALTFAHPGLYPAYLNPRDSLGILPLLRNQWGLDPKTDQQLGGLLMWVPGCFVYLTAILATVTHWYEEAPKRLTV